jgi:hypothetical protein
MRLASTQVAVLAMVGQLPAAAPAYPLLHHDASEVFVELHRVRAAPSSQLRVELHHAAGCRHGLLLAGDSNTRLLLTTALGEALHKGGYTRRYTYPTAAQALGGDCSSPDWCDHTWIYTSDRTPNCSATVWFKFMHSQQELLRVSDWTDSRMCGRKSRDEHSAYKTDPICRDAPRFGPALGSDAMELLAEEPTLAWLGHGLWGHDRDLAQDDWRECRAVAQCTAGSCAPLHCPGVDCGHTSSRTVALNIHSQWCDCSVRFAPHLASFLALSTKGVPVVWASNFPVAGHPMLTNKFLQHDYACQKRAAEQAGIVIADVPAIVAGKRANWDRVDDAKGEWHLSSAELEVLAAVVLAAMVEPPPAAGFLSDAAGLLSNAAGRARYEDDILVSTGERVVMAQQHAVSLRRQEHADKKSAVRMQLLAVMMLGAATVVAMMVGLLLTSRRRV